MLNGKKTYILIGCAIGLQVIQMAQAQSISLLDFEKILELLSIATMRIGIAYALSPDNLKAFVLSYLEQKSVKY